MFPNVRLIVVAILAAIAGIGCGLGLFATFRVNHEPLARLAEGSPPMQLAFDNRALVSDARAGIELRLPVTGVAKIMTVPVIVPTPEPAIEEQAAADSPVAVQTASVEQADAGIEAADRSSTASPAVAVQTELSAVNPEAADAVSTQPSGMNPKAVDAIPIPQEVVATAQDQAAAAPPAAPPNGEQTAAISAAAPDQEPAATPTKAAETKVAKPKARASVAPARRAIKTVRPRRPVATVAAQSAYPYSQPTYSQPVYSQQIYSQPSYTWIDGAAQAAQPVKRVQIQRSRTAKPAKQAKPAAQAAPVAQSTPSASTAGLNGTQ
jgi:hypothetical protein